MGSYVYGFAGLFGACEGFCGPGLGFGRGSEGMQRQHANGTKVLFWVWVGLGGGAKTCNDRKQMERHGKNCHGPARNGTTPDGAARHRKKRNGTTRQTTRKDLVTTTHTSRPRAHLITTSNKTSRPRPDTRPIYVCVHKNVCMCVRLYV